MSADGNSIVITPINWHERAAHWQGQADMRFAQLKHAEALLGDALGHLEIYQAMSRDDWGEDEEQDEMLKDLDAVIERIKGAVAQPPPTSMPSRHTNDPLRYPPRDGHMYQWNGESWVKASEL